MCTIGDVFHGFCRPGQRDIDCRSFIQLCRDGGLNSDSFNDADAEKIFLKAMAVAKRRLDLPRFVEALRYVAEKTGMAEDAVHSTLISHCGRRPMKRTESEPTLKNRHDSGGEEPEVELLDPKRRHHRRHLPSHRRRPKKLEVKEGGQDPSSCQSTPGGAALGTLAGLDSLGTARSKDDDHVVMSGRSASSILHMPSISPSLVMRRRPSVEATSSIEPEPLPSPCGSGRAPELKVTPPPISSTASTLEPEPLPSPCRPGLSIDVKATEDIEGSERSEFATPNTGRSIRLPSSGSPGVVRPSSAHGRPTSPTDSSAAVARGRLSPEDSCAGRHVIPALALSDCGKVCRTPPSDGDRVDGVEEAFSSFCGEHQGLDANGFVVLCKHCGFVDRNFTSQDARLVYSEATPVSLQRMDLRSFEVALAHLATQKGLDRGHIRRMVISQDAAPVPCHAKHQAPASSDKAGGEQLLPLMPVAPLPVAQLPATPAIGDAQDPVCRPALASRGRRDLGEHPMPPRNANRSMPKLRSLRRCETMPPAFGSKDKPLFGADPALPSTPGLAAPLQAGEHSDAEAPPTAVDVEPKEPLAPGAPPAGEGEPADEASEAMPSEAPSLEFSGQAEIDESPRPPSHLTSRPAMPMPSGPSDQACHLMPLVCAR